MQRSFDHFAALLACLAMFTVLLSGCLCPSSQPEVVVYTALDREFSEPILQDFETAQGVRVLPRYDVESTKSAQLAGDIILERDRPRCDVFWNNEIMHTLRLENEGLLQAYFSPAAESFPADVKSPDGYWHGLAARSRVLIVNTDKFKPEDRPHSIHDLVDPAFQGKVGVAKPLFGTTATHAAVLFDMWGEEKATMFFKQLHANAEVMSGNKQVATAVSSGQLWFGVTDTDDAIIEVEKGMPVAIVFPDQGEGELGALFIPNTLAIVKDCPHPQQAKKLIDHLLQPEVETRLAKGASAQFPLNKNVTESPRAAPALPVRRMQVDFRSAAKKWQTTAAILRDIFQSGG